MIGNRAIALLVLSGFLPLLIGCNLPGRPHAGPEVPRPEEIQTFSALYKQNCAACHGAEGQQGPATNLANPLYEAWIDDSSLRAVIERGEAHSLMPAFSRSRGGTLTPQQIDILVRGMRAKWAKPGVTAEASMPSYHAATEGIVSRGQTVYVAGCAQCHGATAQQAGAAGSILDPTFLALMNAQTLRTIIVAGRPDIGQPDWRNDVSGRPLTEAEVADVVAWMLAQSSTNTSEPQAIHKP